MSLDNIVLIIFTYSFVIFTLPYIVIALNLEIDQSCFISIVMDTNVNGQEYNQLFKATPTSPISTHNNTFTHTFTLYDVENFDFLPWSNHTAEYELFPTVNSFNVSITTGYFRFTRRLSKPCIAFILISPSFYKTVRAIQRSGYGTSDNVMFLIATSSLTEDNEIVSGFLNNLLDSEGPAFHAPISFFTYPEGQIGMFCYFCQEKQKRIQKLEGKQSFVRMQIALKKMNSNGYGQKLYLSNYFIVYRERAQSCFNFYNINRVRTNVFGEHVSCNNPKLWEMAFLQGYFNVTAMFVGHLEVDDKKWFLRVEFKENFGSSVTNDYLEFRVSIHTIEEIWLEILSCRNLRDIQQISWGITSGFDGWIWGCLVFSLGIYSLPYGSIKKGLDLTLTFFGQSLMCTHRKCMVFTLLLMVSLLSYIYQSVVSVDAMQLAEFPTLPQLIKEGHKIWEDYVHRIHTAYAEVLYRRVKYHVDSWRNAFLDNRFYEKGKGLAFYTRMATLKGFVTSGTHSELISIIGNGNTIYIGKNLVCKVFRPADEMSLYVRYSLRFWSYLSGPFSNAVKQFRAAGLYERVLRLSRDSAATEMRTLRLTKADAFLEPLPISLVSAIGIFCFIQLALVGTAFVWVLLCWGKVRKNDVFGFFKKLRQKIKLKQRCNTTKFMNACSVIWIKVFCRSRWYRNTASNSNN
ncbi:unnamed protein product [Orchesella dallaii]|uniref:Uncharacterized protein n=1 Tax=Orchesella dallaii TaxID=48710 RepID=A0ABP1RAA8_9HEXA